MQNPSRRTHAITPHSNNSRDCNILRPVSTANAILLVEDEALIAMAEKTRLEQHGFAVTTAGDGEEAVHLVGSQAFDLVLMDIDLGSGKMDGTSAARRILERVDVPIVFLTSHSEREMVERVEGISGYGYVLKNSGTFVLVESIRMALKLHRAHRDLEEREQRYFSLFNSFRDPITVYDRDATIVDLNDAGLDGVAGDRLDVIGKSLGDVVPDMKAETVRRIERCLRGDGDEVYRDEITLPDGTQRVYESIFLPLGTRDDLVQVVSYDVSSQVGTLSRLRRSEERLRAQYDNAPIATYSWCIDRDSATLFEVNRAAIEETNGAAGQSIGLSAEKFYPDRPDIVAKIHESNRTQKTILQTTEYITPSTNEHKVLSITYVAVPPNVVVMYVDNISIQWAMRTEIENELDNLRLSHQIGNIGCWQYDPETDTAIWCEQVYRMYDRDPALGPLPLDEYDAICAPDQIEKLRAAFADAREYGTPYDILIRLDLPSKGPRWVRSVCRPDLSRGAHGYGLRGIVQDVTEHTELTRKLERILNSSVDGIVEVDDKNRIASANASYYELSGYSPEELIGMSVFDLDASGDEAIETFLVEIYDNNGNRYETKHRKKDGSVFDVEVSSVVDQDGRGHVSFIRDVSERKEAERVLNKERALLRHAEELAGVGWFEWDIRRERWVYSPTWRAIHGIDGMKESITRLERLIHPDDRRRVLIALNRAKRAGGSYEIEHRIVRAVDGEQRYVRAVGEVESIDGVPTRLIGITQDITPFRETEDRLTKALSENIDLIREINHRVKNNLAMVASLIRLKLRTTSTGDALGDLLNQVDAIAAVHEQLQDVGTYRQIAVREYLPRLLEKVFSQWTAAPVLIEANIADILVDTRTGTSLGLILNELATNAMKHAFPELTQPRFLVDFRPDQRADDLVLDVTNNGPAIPEDVEFDGPATLGLRLVKSLVEQLSGTIELHRSPPTFVMRFPRNK